MKQREPQRQGGFQDARSAKSTAGKSFPAVLKAPLQRKAATSAQDSGQVIQRFTRSKLNNSTMELESDGNSMAVHMNSERSNELYSTRAAVQTANQKLGKAAQQENAILSLRLDTDESITTKDSGTKLYEVSPEISAGESKSSSKAVQESIAINKTASSRTTASDMPKHLDRGLTLPGDCGYSCDLVTGNPDREIGVYNASGQTKAPLVKEKGASIVGVDRSEAHEASRTAYYVHWLPFLTRRMATENNAIPRGIARPGDKLRAPRNAAEAMHLYMMLPPAEKFEFDRFAGINRFAQPEIGGAYTMVAEENAAGFRIDTERFWPFHWAGVVMADGYDSVVLENFAALIPADKSKRKSKKQKPKMVMNQEWEFQMYGTLDVDDAIYNPNEAETDTFYGRELAKGLYGNKATAIATYNQKEEAAAPKKGGKAEEVKAKAKTSKGKKHKKSKKKQRRKKVEPVKAAAPVKPEVQEEIAADVEAVALVVEED